MGKWGWFSCDADTGDVVSKTDVKNDGSVHRYDYTRPDDISAGHGHSRFDSMDDYINDNSSWSRDKDDSSSKGRGWNGNGYNLDMNILNNLSISDLKYLKSKALEFSININDNKSFLLVKKCH